MARIYSGRDLHTSEPQVLRMKKDVFEKIGDATFFSRIIKTSTYVKTGGNDRNYYTTEKKVSVVAAIFFCITLPLSLVSLAAHQLSKTHKNTENDLERRGCRVKFKIVKNQGTDEERNRLRQFVEARPAFTVARHGSVVALESEELFRTNGHGRITPPKSLFRLKSGAGFRIATGQRNGRLVIKDYDLGALNIPLAKSKNDTKMTHLLALSEKIRLDSPPPPPPPPPPPIEQEEPVNPVLVGLGGFRRINIPRVPPPPPKPPVYDEKVEALSSLGLKIEAKLRDGSCHLRKEGADIEGHFVDRLDIVIQPLNGSKTLKLTYNCEEDLKTTHCLKVPAEHVEIAIEAIAQHRLEKFEYQLSDSWKEASSKKTEQFTQNGIKYFDTLKKLAEDASSNRSSGFSSLQSRRLLQLFNRFKDCEESKKPREYEIKALIGNIVMFSTAGKQHFPPILQELAASETDLTELKNKLFEILARLNPLQELTTVANQVLQKAKETKEYQELSRSLKQSYDRTDSDIVSNLTTYIEKAQNMVASDQKIRDTRHDNFKIALCNLHFLKHFPGNEKNREALIILSDSGRGQLCDGARTNAGELALNMLNPLVKSDLMVEFLTMRDNFLEGLIQEEGGKSGSDGQNVHTMEKMRNLLALNGFASFKARYDQYQMCAAHGITELVNNVLERATFSNFLTFVYDKVLENIALDKAVAVEDESRGVQSYYHDKIKAPLHERHIFLSESNPEGYVEYRAKLEKARLEKAPLIESYSEKNILIAFNEAKNLLTTSSQYQNDEGEYRFAALRQSIRFDKTLSSLQKFAKNKVLDLIVEKADNLENVLLAAIRDEAEKRLKDLISQGETEIINQALEKPNWVFLDENNQVAFISRKAIAEALVQSQCAVAEPNEGLGRQFALETNLPQEGFGGVFQAERLQINPHLHNQRAIFRDFARDDPRLEIINQLFNEALLELQNGFVGFNV